MGMKVLFLKWESFGNAQMTKALKEYGAEVIDLHTTQEELLTGVIEEKIENSLKKETPDIIYSFNYFPNVAKTAASHDISYYSWVYDNPCVQLYSHTVLLPTNHIYVFDSDTYLKFASQGIKTICYLPMAAQPADLIKPGKNIRYDYDISFVGSLYTEKHNFYDRMISKGLTEYSMGYLRGIMEAQKNLYGMNIVEILLTEPVIDDMHSALPLEPDADSVITKRTLFTEYVINRRITAEERRHALSLLGERFGNVTVFTPDPSVSIQGCKNMGPVDPDRGAPSVFASSRINLNISLRSIVNGIPLRCFEIMGAGGFLLTDYAADMTQFFTEGEDYVSYDSMADMADKCGYYLKNEAERQQIAENGIKKIRDAHTYLHRVREMFEG